MKVLLTGPTGLLGSALLPRLLERGHEVLAVSRSRGGLPAVERLRRVLQAHGLAFLAAGLRVHDPAEGALRTWAARNGPVEAVVHTAAAVKFTLSPGDLHRENVEATGSLLEDIDAAAPGARFAYVSTAYVSGDRSGVCQEDQGRMGQAFRQPYEESKLLAEELVAERCRRQGRPFSIFRPGIIVGDSRSGLAANFNGFGHFLRALDALARSGRPPQEPVAVRCDRRATKNLVPVDWVSEAIAALLEQPEDGIYHLTHPRPVSHQSILELVREVLALTGLMILEERSAPAPAGPLQRRLDQGLRSLAPYFWGEPVFDRSRLEAALGEAAEPPPFDRRLLCRLLDFGRSARWGDHPLEEPVPAGGPRPGRLATAGHAKEES